MTPLFHWVWSLVVGLHLTAPSTPHQYTYRWHELSAQAAFAKSYNFQLFSLKDTLWAFHPSGNWYSLDGKQWEKSPLPNALKNLAFLDYVPFGKGVLALGTFEGNIERFAQTSRVQQTTDLRTWEVLAQECNLPKRFFYHPFVFRGKIWIVGGEDAQRQYADVWNSPDGVHWAKQADHLPFGKGSGEQFVVMGERVYRLGSDVWSSSDGLHWQQDTRAIQPGVELFGYQAVVFEGRIWLLGCNRNGQFTSNVLWSADGTQWHQMQAPWTPRGGVAACVHRGKLYLTGGKYGGQGNDPEFVYSNDVWVLEKQEVKP